MLAILTLRARCSVLFGGEWDVDVNLCLQVTGYAADKLDEALQGVEVVVIPAGVPRKPGVSPTSCCPLSRSNTPADDA
ncbi:hypothetical protein M422DRAFT_255509, partial [Sphaerobolus stellatus SS14]